MKVKIGKYKKNRKVDIRIDPFDVWNMDHTLALIILPMLKKLKEVKHGSPMVDLTDVPHPLDRVGFEDINRNQGNLFEGFWGGKDEYYKESWDILHQRWEWVLNEMIFAFEDIVSDEDTFENRDRVQNGLRLFGKYYKGLWD